MKKKCLFLFLGILFLLSGCGSEGIDNALNYEIDTFSFTNQDEKNVSLEDLEGKVWVANFMFTNCTTVCPPMTANMTQLQQMASQENLDVHFISFSVDPAVDTPATMKEFANRYPLSLSNWDFLTGYSQEDIEKFALKSFKTIVKKPENEDQVIHGTSFYLVDQNGKVMKSYSGVEQPPYEEMIADIKKLQ